MAKAEFHLRALPPSEALKRFVNASSAAFGNSQVTAISVNTNLVPDGQFAIEAAAANSIANSASYKETIAAMDAQSPFLQIRQIHVSQPDGPNNQQSVTLNYESDDDIVARLTVTVAQESLFKQRIAGIAKALNDSFTLTRRGELIGQYLSEAERDKLKFYERSLSELNAATVKLDTLLLEQVDRRAKHFQERAAKQDTELRERAAQQDAELRERASAQQKEFEARLASITERPNSAL